MTGIYPYSVAILMGVAVFGAILVLMRLFHNRRLQSAQGVIQRLENTALRDLGEQALPDKKLRVEELVPARPSLFGIPYVAWISKIENLTIHSNGVSLIQPMVCSSRTP